MYIFKKYFRRKFANVGATAIEYALIASLIAVSAIGGYKAVGSKYSKIYNDISNAL
jgi:Flp pilus assembly pilin Flp